MTSIELILYIILAFWVILLAACAYELFTDHGLDYISRTEKALFREVRTRRMLTIFLLGMVPTVIVWAGNCAINQPSPAEKLLLGEDAAEEIIEEVPQ